MQTSMLYASKKSKCWIRIINFNLLEGISAIEGGPTDFFGASVRSAMSPTAHRVISLENLLTDPPGCLCSLGPGSEVKSNISERAEKPRNAKLPNLGTKAPSCGQPYRISSIPEGNTK